MSSKYVLVPADKAAKIVIVVCKKYYLKVVHTYKQVDRECMHVVTEHLNFMTNIYKVYVDPELRYLLLATKIT